MYQALYRKYRPRTFDDVSGQEHITDTLRSQVTSGRLSHAYLFIGTHGTGKTTCAKILAKAVNCESPVDGNPCCRCAACLGIEDGSVLDVVEIDAASNNGVENVRALREEAVFSPASVKKRVYIIDEVHMLSIAAFNALLKILEEPPAHLMFILATTELRKVPATILSRCQRYSFRRLDSSVIAKRLDHVAAQESMKLTKDASSLLSRLADGAMRDGLSLLDQCSGSEVIDPDTVLLAMGLAGSRRIAQLLGAIADHDAKTALDHFAELWRDGKDPAGLLSDLGALMRDVLMLSLAPRGGTELLSGTYELGTLKDFAARFTKAELLRAIERIGQSLASMRDNPSPRTVAELCLVALCDPRLCDELPELLARVSRLEEGAVPVQLTASVTAAGIGQEAEHIISDEPLAPPVTDSPESTPEPEAQPEPQYVRDEAEPIPVPEPVYYEPEPEPPYVPDNRPEYTEPETSEPDKAEPAPIVSAETAAAPASDVSWSKLVSRMRDELPVGLYNLLNDPMQATGEFSEGLLLLRIAPGFAFNMLNKQNIITKFRDAAAAMTGSEIRVDVLVLESDENIVSRSIDELEKFKQVKFI